MATHKATRARFGVKADGALRRGGQRDQVNSGRFGLEDSRASVDQSADCVPLLPRHSLREDALTHGAEAAAWVTWKRTETDNTSGRFGARRVGSGEGRELVEDLKDGDLNLFDCLEAVRLDAHKVGRFVVVVECVPNPGHRVANRRDS